jgi:hypothetical protein
MYSFKKYLGSIILIISLLNILISCKDDTNDFIGTWELSGNPECYLKFKDDGTGELWITKDRTQQLDYISQMTDLQLVKYNFEMSSLFSVGFSEFKWKIKDDKIEIVVTNSLKKSQEKIYFENNPFAIGKYELDTLTYLFKFFDSKIKLYEPYGADYREFVFNKTGKPNDVKKENLIVGEYSEKSDLPVKNVRYKYSKNHTFQISSDLQLSKTVQFSMKINGYWTIANNHLLHNYTDVVTSPEEYQTMVQNEEWEKLKFQKYRIITFEPNKLIYQNIDDSDSDTLMRK